ncbi:MAG: hypothetical protein JXX14_12030 [Deltaproteobacteria bacterium]|nr:hypothetical protein [Deltaproteobacteria bacterium]
MPNSNDTPANGTTDRDALVARFNKAQSAFLESQEYMDYYWSLDTLSFEVEMPRFRLVYPLVPVGTWSGITGRFTWGFAVSHFPLCAQNAAACLRDLGQKYGHPQYDSDYFDLPHVDLDDLLALVHDHLKTEVVFKEKGMEPWLFFALGRPEKRPLPVERQQND